MNATLRTAVIPLVSVKMFYTYLPFKIDYTGYCTGFFFLLPTYPRRHFIKSEVVLVFTSLKKKKLAKGSAAERSDLFHFEGHPDAKNPLGTSC